MTTTPLITVLVPTIGRMDYLPMTRRSLAEQTRKDFRVVVLDNASGPEAQAFFADWAREDSRVEIMRSDPRIPMFSNFNLGMCAVRTPLVTFFHDDDEYCTDYLEVLAGELEKHPRAAFAGSNFDIIDGAGAVIERRRWIAKTELMDASRYVKELFRRGRNLVSMSGLVFRRDAFGPDGFDESLPIRWGDFVLLMRAAEDGGMVAVERTVVRVRMHSGQASLQARSQAILQRTDVMARYVDEYASRHPDERALVAELRSRLAVTHRAGMLWGWVVAEDEVERSACRDLLGPAPVDSALRRVLVWADRRGLRPNRVGPGLMNAARRGANLLRL